MYSIGDIPVYNKTGAVGGSGDPSELGTCQVFDFFDKKGSTRATIINDEVRPG